MEREENVPVPPVTPSQEVDDRSLKRKRQGDDVDLNKTKRACNQTCNETIPNNEEFWTEDQLAKLYPGQMDMNSKDDFRHDIGDVQSMLTELNVSKESPPKEYRRMKECKRSSEESMDQSKLDEMAVISSPSVGFPSRTSSSPELLKTPSISPISGTSPQSSPEMIECLNDPIEEDIKSGGKQSHNSNDDPREQG